jgi:uncharacterized protein YciI
MARFAVEFVYGPDRDGRMAVRPKHREYLGTLVERGVLQLSGPYADDTGALLIFKVADEAELKGILAADPYADANVLAETRVHEWNALLGTLI